MIGITTSNIKYVEKNFSKILNLNNIKTIDCSITNLTSKNWDTITEKDVLKISNMLECDNIKVSSIQSIFYGMALCFSNTDDLANILSHIDKLCDFADILNTDRLLFGSPSQRIVKGNKKNFLKTILEINKLIKKRNKKFSIENIESIDNIEFRSYLEILSGIHENKLSNCGLNYHWFLDEGIEKIEKCFLEPNLHSIHISTRKYDTNFVIDGKIQSVNRIIRDSPVDILLEISADNFASAIKPINLFFRT